MKSKIAMFVAVCVVFCYWGLSASAEEIVVQPGPEDGTDAWITSVYYGGGRDDQNLKVGGWGDYYYSMIKFNIDNLPTDATSVKLYLYAIKWSDYAPISMYLDRITSPWDENTKWASRPSFSNNGTILAPTPYTWYIIDITEQYSGWKSGAFENYGIQLRPTNNWHTLSGFYTSDYMEDPSLRPKLVIETPTIFSPIYNFSTESNPSGSPEVVSLFDSSSFVSGTFTYDNETAATGTASAGHTVYGGATSNLVGSVDGMNFSDPEGFIAVGNDTFSREYITEPAVDFLQIGAEPPHLEDPGTRDISGFVIGDYTLINVRMFWIEELLDITDFLENQDLLAVLPDLEGRLALDFVHTNLPDGPVYCVFFDGLHVQPGTQPPITITAPLLNNTPPLTSLPVNNATEIDPTNVNFQWNPGIHSEGAILEYCISVYEDGTPTDIPVFLGCHDGIFTTETTFPLNQYVTLDYGKKFWWTVRAKDEYGNWSEPSESWNFTTINNDNDNDGDGIPDNLDEDDDNDGMPDEWEAEYGLVFGLSTLEADSDKWDADYRHTAIEYFQSYALMQQGAYSVRHLSQTRYGIDTKNYDNDWGNSKENFVESTVEGKIKSKLITHALYPFQNGTMSGPFSGFKWDADNALIYVSTGQEVDDDNREPLILIHGWKANHDGNFEDRDPEELAKTADEENEYDAEGYWWTFLRYFEATPALNKKYKLYLYQYPTYKHVTFNARMLSNMLHEVKYIREWIENGGKIAILAHSMGGLVARSMLEEHNGIWYEDNGSWQNVPGYGFLDKLITLDTPHHGSPAAVYPWLDEASLAQIIIDKDIYSPGSMDLWWDGYDNAYKLIPDSDLDECPGGPPTEANANLSDSWRSEGDLAFDMYYRSKLDAYLQTSRNIEACLGTAYVTFYEYPNPWLIYLNGIHEAYKDIWQSRYIFYGGYNDNSAVHPSNKLEDTAIGLADNAWFLGVWEAGYLNDAPVPVSSSFFDQDADVFSIDGWPEDNKVLLFNNFLENQQKNILINIFNGYQIRFFRDYNHDFMLNGAYTHEENGIEGYCDSNWYWDLVKNSELPPPCYSLDWDAWHVRDYSAFKSAEIRQAYVRDAGLSIPIDRFSVNAHNVNKDHDWINTLEYEPLFLLITSDLADDSDEDGIPDENESRSNPLLADTDGDGLLDGIEDADHNGVVDLGETDPCNADTDNDGLIGGSTNCEDLNANGIVDPGETDPRSPDTDGDGIFDGTERGLTAPETADTDVSAGFFVADTDPSTTTDPTDADSDEDGILDGNEDKNHDGLVDPSGGETDPGNPDSDGDGIYDATEMGLTEPQDAEATDLSQGHFVPDSDPTSTTDPTSSDSDGDGTGDGDEDVNKDGSFSPELGETDPNLAAGIPGDLDADGDIDSTDYSLFRSTLGKCNGDAGFIADADYDEDGCVTYADYRIWYGYYRNQ